MRNAILRTLAYADIFDYPLTQEEIWRWLMGNLKFKIENLKFNESLRRLLREKLYGKKGGFYFLSGRGKIVEIRKQRERWSGKKIKKASRVAGILRLIPWIKLIGITGGLALKNADLNDDIDLFFITSKDRIWLTRGLVVLILRLLQVYRRPEKISDMICPNMFITEKSLRMQPEDLFIAHEVCQMQPIFVRNQTYQKFLGANLWVRKFLPNWRP